MESSVLQGRYFDRVVHYASDLRVDYRWVLKNLENDMPCGSLRIMSDNDLPPGYLRAIFKYVITLHKKSDDEVSALVEEYQMDRSELSKYSLDYDMETKDIVMVDTIDNLTKIFNITL